MGVAAHKKRVKKHLFLQTGHRDDRPNDPDNRPDDRDENTSDRDVYPADVFALTGHRDKNTADWDAFLEVFLGDWGTK